MKNTDYTVNHPIDFVVTWLDSSDKLWQKEYFKYKGEYSSGDQSESRFRNWDLFRFWFRAVERYAPWVNKVYLITNGTFPKWINDLNPKLVLVNHKDYIPVQFLPTFNSCTIELHMHRIPGLSEHFVYFNDDCFINGHIDPDYYFRKGLPCDNNKETILNAPIYDKDFKFGIYPSLLTNIGVINANFHRWNTVKSSLTKWFGPHLGIRGILTSVMLGRQRRFVGFNWRHLDTTVDLLFRSEESTRILGDLLSLDRNIFEYPLLDGLSLSIKGRHRNLQFAPVFMREGEHLEGGWFSVL